MIIGVLNTKGGVGKTTTSLNLAIMAALAGHNVLAVDGDRQASLMAALANRETGPAIPVVNYADGKVLRQQVSIAKDKYDHIIIDAGGRDNSSLRATLVLADLVLIPFQPRSFDVWALGDMSELLEEARSVRDVRAVAFLSLADPAGRGADNREAADSVPSGIECLGLNVGRRKAVAEAAGFGLAAVETGKDHKAIAELKQLYNAVFTQEVRKIYV